jgi:hypothetical protein
VSDSQPVEPRHARSDQVEASEVGDRIVLYHRVSRAALVLNPTGSRLWERLASPATTEDLTAALRERFPALAPEHALLDVTAFLDDLTRHGAIVAVP